MSDLVYQPIAEQTPEQTTEQTSNDSTTVKYTNIINEGGLIKSDQERRNKELKEQIDENKKNTKVLQNILTKSANPSPVYIIIIVIGVIIALWFIHYIFIKPKLTGEWYPESGSDVWKLKHRFMSNTVDVTINEKKHGTLEVVDNLISYNGRIAIWNYGNTILFTNGMILTRSLN
jgi:hypothetical protein